MVRDYSPFNSPVLTYTYTAGTSNLWSSALGSLIGASDLVSGTVTPHSHRIYTSNPSDTEVILSGENNFGPVDLQVDQPHYILISLVNS